MVLPPMSSFRHLSILTTMHPSLLLGKEKKMGIDAHIHKRTNHSHMHHAHTHQSFTYAQFTYTPFIHLHTNSFPYTRKTYVSMRS